MIKSSRRDGEVDFSQLRGRLVRRSNVVKRSGLTEPGPEAPFSSPRGKGERAI